MAISTSKTSQQIIIAYYTAALRMMKIEPIKSSGHGPHIRLNYKGDVDQLFNSILPCTIKSSDVKMSGQYSTQEITIKKEIPGVKVGDSIYLVITTRSTGVLRNKQLTPDSLKLGGQKISASNFYNVALQAIQKSSADENIKRFLKDLMVASATKTGALTVSNISESDINVIAKDFGEISSAYWLLKVHNPRIDSIEYPSISNQRLVDYYAYVGESKIAISAKANEGAPPSIDVIADVLETMRYKDAKKEEARKAIIAISKNSVVDGIVSAARELDQPTYTILKKKYFKKDFNAADIENFLKQFKSPQMFNLEFEDYYKAIGRSVKEDSVQRIFKLKQRRWGLIISPMGYALVDVLNKNDLYNHVLNDAAKTIKVTQLYTKITKTAVNYRIKEFSDAHFLFRYNANALNPGLKKISFEMKK